MSEDPSTPEPPDPDGTTRRDPSSSGSAPAGGRSFLRLAVPDHELLRCIGRGSYGEVWLARNVMGLYRAVKVVFRDRFDSDRPFDREFSGITKFEPISRSHPSQVNILHVGRQPGYFFYVMELADDANAESTLTLPSDPLSPPMGEGRGEGAPLAIANRKSQIPRPTPPRRCAAKSNAAAGCLSTNAWRSPSV